MKEPVAGNAYDGNRRWVDFFTNERRYDTGKARRLLGFRPAVRLEDGLGRTAAWYREQGLLPR